MVHADQFRKSVAFTAAGLLVIWTCGSGLTAVYKLVYRLVLGVWPNTLLYGVVPQDWLPAAATVAQGDMPAMVWAFLLGRDVLTCLLLLPPLLLLPCLFLLRAEHGGMLPALRSTANPFSPGRPQGTGLPAPARRPGDGLFSTKNRT